MMNEITFFTVVAKMREAQRKFFLTRNKDWLIESKRLEKIVDAEILARTKWYDVGALKIAYAPYDKIYST